MEDILRSKSRKEILTLMRIVLTRGMVGGFGSWEDYLMLHDQQFANMIPSPSARNLGFSIGFIMSLGRDDLGTIASLLSPIHADVHNLRQLRIDGLSEKQEKYHRLILLTLNHEDFPFDFMVAYNEEDWVVTRNVGLNMPPFYHELPKVDLVYLSCALVLCADGSEAPVRVRMLSRGNFRADQVLLDEFVMPSQPISDYREDVTGITAESFELWESTPWAEIRPQIQSLLSVDSIVIGHGLNKQLKALKMCHAKVIDTSLVFRYNDYDYTTNGEHPKPSLDYITQSLGYVVLPTGHGRCHNEGKLVEHLLRLVRNRDYLRFLQLPP